MEAFISERNDLWKVKELQQHLDQDWGIERTEAQIKRLLKKHMGMSYRRVGAVTPAMNLERNKLLRQQAAAEYIVNLHDPDHEIIAIDETILRTTNNTQYCWQKKGRSTM
jgi:hypothetical protein